MFKPDVREVTRIPIARALLEIKAMAASPLIFEFELTRSSKNAAITQTGIETARGAQLKAIAMAIVPKPTWLKPSPIMENRFNTSVTPKSEAQMEIIIPATSARVKNP